ncbi:MAG: hypothetical protein ACN6OM_03905 [Alcaligenes nematophilus]|uniref:hypothetical protein n=1 Tax=Alcaligenes nematophilus TaxID=2994643 RepID=UPI003CFBC3A4
MRLNVKLAATWLFAAISGGAIGGFIGIAFTSWLDKQPMILGANWWDVLTALGTVGAVLIAVGLAFYQRAKDEALRREESVPIRYAIQPELILLANKLTDSYWIISNHLRQLRDWPRLHEHSVLKLDELAEAARLETCQSLLNKLHRLPPAECRLISLVIGNVNFCVVANRMARNVDAEHPNYDFFVDPMIEKLKIYRDVSGYLFTLLGKYDFPEKKHVLWLLKSVATHRHWLDSSKP